MSASQAGRAGYAANETDPSTGVDVGHEVWLRIANHTIRFRSARDEVKLFLHDNHLPFRIPPSEVADCDVVWDIGGVHPADGPVVRRFEDRWEIRVVGADREEVTFYNATPDDPTRSPTMQMRSDAEFASVRVRQAPRPGESIAYVSEYPWAEYIVQRRLGLHGGAMLHASMAVWGDRAHLFLGHSGAGKSTMAELAEQVGATIPSDDRTIVSMVEGVPTAWGTPWHGSFRRTSPARAAIASISLLVQDVEDGLTALDSGRAVKEMFVRTVQARITEREVQGTLDTLIALAASVPCFELHFRPTTAAVDLVRSTVARASAAESRGSGAD